MESTKIISVEAIQNISQLKDNIKALKQEVSTLTVGTDEYNEAVIALAENQRALKLAQTGTYDSMLEIAKASKLDTDAINATVESAKKGTSTYYEMSAALGQLKTEIKSIPKYLNEQDQALGQINPSYQELSTKIQTLDTALKSLDADNGVFSRNVGNYLGALKEWGGTLGQVQQVGSQLMSGILALVGVMSMFGVDTDETKESLQALVPVLAVLNGAKAIGGLTKLFPSAASGAKKLTAETIKNTAANTANAASTKAAAVATTEQTVAQESLNTAMLANPILAIIAGITALITAIGGYLAIANSATKQTKEFEESQKKLNEKFEEEMEDLEQNNRILEAQGANTNELIQKKIDLIAKYREEKEAIVKANEKRLEEIEQHTWLGKLFRGELGERKRLIEQNEKLNEEIKEYNKNIKGLKTDQRVNDINKATEAAKKLTETYKKDLSNGLNVAVSKIKNVRSELGNLNFDFTENKNAIESAITATNELIEQNRKLFSKTKDAKKRNEIEKEYISLLDKKDKLESGLLALNTERIETLNAYYAKEYEKKVLIWTKELNYETKKKTQYETDYEKVMRNIFGYSESQIRAAQQATQETENQLTVYNKLKQMIGDTIREIGGLEKGVDLSNLVVSGLNWEQMVKLSQTDAERLARNVGEPLSTAIGLYFKNDENIKSTILKQAEEITSVFNEGFDRAIQRGNYWAAKGLYKNAAIKLKELFGDNAEIKPILDKWIEDTGNILADILKDDPLGAVLTKTYTGKGGFLHNFLGTKDEIKESIDENIEVIKQEIEQLKAEHISAIINGEDEEKRLAIVDAMFGKEGELAAAIKQRFDTITGVYSQFLENYGSSTANVLDAVSDLWDNALKLKYKKLVESGKLSEKEAEKQAEEEFKTVKALQIGVAAINTAAAIVSALADPSVPSYYVKAANAIAAGVAGAAQILTISMTDFGKPSVNTSTSTSTPSYTSEPQPVYYSYGINPADYAEAQAQNPVKVYVTDQDLAEGIDNYHSKKAEVTF